MKCYLCHNEINEKNKTKEHIIPNLIGGRLKSEKIICISCNSEYGQTLDKIFEEIPLSTILNINKERGETQKIRATEQSGQKILIDSNLTPELEKLRVEIEDGNRVFTVRNEDEARKIFKQHKIKNIEEELKKIIWKYEIIKEPVLLDNDIFSGKKQFRAISKIAVSYYYHLTSCLTGLSNIISFIRNEIDLLCVCYYYPDDNVYTPDDKEISHLMLVRGNPTEKILYCYMELFNCYCFVILLNDNYTGSDLKECYIYDLEKKTELGKSVSLELTRDKLLSLPKPGPVNTQELFMYRMKDTLKKKEIDFSVYKNKNLRPTRG
jgi:hypothetical protein